MTIIRVGATKKYSDGWESAFGKGKKSTAATPAKKATKKAASKLAPAKPAKSAKKKSPAKKKK